MSSLKQRTVSGFKWLVINNVAQKAISVATFAILARFLTPSVFGLFSMAFIAIDGLGLFKAFGLDGGIVQKKDCPDAANHTAFIIIASMSLVVFGVCYAIAPFVARFFNNEDLGSVVRALGLVFFVGGFGRVPSAILTRNLRFRLISIIDLIGSTVNCFFAVVFATFSPTVWSLVAAYLIRHSIMMSLSWYFSGYRFKWEFHPSLAKELFRFGRFLLGLSLLSYVSANISNLVIGKLLGVAAVGYLTLAGNIGNFINSHFTHVISRVMFPAYSRIQDDREQLGRAYLKTIKYITMLTLPYSMGLICLSKEFVLTLYGEKWLAIIPLIRLLGFCQILVPFSIASGSLFRGAGKPSYDFFMNLGTLFVHIPLMTILSLKIGIFGPATSALVIVVVLVPFELMLIRRIVFVRVSDFIRQFVPAASCSLIMVVAIQAFRALIRLYPVFKVFEFNHLTLLFSLGVVGLLSYAVSFLLFDRKASMEVKRMIFNLEGA